MVFIEIWAVVNKQYLNIIMKIDIWVIVQQWWVEIFICREKIKYHVTYDTKINWEIRIKSI